MCRTLVSVCVSAFTSDWIWWGVFFLFLLHLILFIFYSDDWYCSLSLPYLSWLFHFDWNQYYVCSASAVFISIKLRPLANHIAIIKQWVRLSAWDTPVGHSQTSQIFFLAIFMTASIAEHNSNILFIFIGKLDNNARYYGEVRAPQIVAKSLNLSHHFYRSC